MTDFDTGVLYAAGLLAGFHDQPTMAADIIVSAGLNKVDCSDLDEFDKEGLRLITDSRIKLKGL